MKARESGRIRRIAAGLLLLACSAVLRAKGARESPALTPLRNLTLQTESGAPRKVEYSISSAAGMGATILTIGWTPFTVRWAVVQDDDGILDGPVGAGVTEALETAGAPEYALRPGVAVLPIGEATVTFGNIRNFGGDPLHEAAGGSCRIPICTYGADRHLRVLLIHADGSWERIRFTTRLEFFPGEAALFATRADLPYHKKVLAFLDAFFPAGTEEQAAFRRAAVRQLSWRYPDLAGDDSFWDAFRDTPGLDGCRNGFRSVFLRHMAPVKGNLSDGSGNTTLSRPAWDSVRWDMLYGGGGSPYVAAYLGYLSEIGKPVFSKVLDSELRRTDPGYSYDWRQYGPISAEDGKELARAALRYLHWGVEYTLASDRAGSEAVYEANREPLISDWVSGGNPAYDRTSNYLPPWAVPVPITPADGETGDLEQAVAADDPLMLSSPFEGGKGNPIPYANAGIDSPRTFAYKMREQVKVREWYRLNALVADRLPESAATTAAPEGFPGDEYVNERRLMARLGRYIGMHREGWCYDVYQPTPLPNAGSGTVLGSYGSEADVLKPFIPGTGAMGGFRFMADVLPGPYNSDKTAGTDCMGLLSGSIAMTSFYSNVLDANNGKPASNLDGYYAMRPGSPGLDASGYPAFYADPWPDGSCSRGGYRLRRDDLERGTVLLHDISDIRLGDLLIRDDPKEGVLVGVVVGFLSADRPVPGQDGSSFMKEVIVLSTDSAQGRAFLSRWDGGLFTTKPKEFQVRRLLILSGSSSAVYGSDPWELVDSGYSGLQVALTFPGQTDDVAGSQWIPNTGDWLVMDKVGLKRMNAWGIGETIDAATKPMVAVLGPKDYAFRVDDTAGRSNLYSNKGGDIGFWALPLPADRVRGKHPVLISTFHRDEGAEDYRSTPNPALFQLDWQWKTGVELTVGSDCLVFCGGGLPRTTTFGLRVADMQTARPGDDILLRFGLVEKRDANGPYETVVAGTAEEADFAAVYDLPMLWRANLYLDEGANDWNNKHPWVTGNEWNTPPAGYAGIPGGQIYKFPNTTWPGRWNSGAGSFEGARTQADRVAYDFWGQDSPFDYLKKTGFQKEYLQHGYKASGVFEWNGGIVIPALRWQKTTPPPSNAPSYINYLVRDNVGANVNAAFTNELSGQQTLSSSYPYVPSFTYWYDYRFGADDIAKRAYSSGLDCVAFLHQAISYAGQTYKDISTVDASAWVENAGETGFRKWPGAHAQYCVEIARKPEQEDDPAPVAINRIIPGDIIWYVYYREGTGGAFDLQGHIAIVSSVDVTQQRRYSDIHVIESVYGAHPDGSRFGGVVNHRTLLDIQNFVSTITSRPVLWRIGRLRQ